MQRIHTLGRRELNTIMHFTGNVCLILAVAMLVPLIVAVIYKEPQSEAREQNLKSPSKN